MAALGRCRRDLSVDAPLGVRLHYSTQTVVEKISFLNSPKVVWFLTWRARYCCTELFAYLDALLVCKYAIVRIIIVGDRSSGARQGLFLP